MITTLLFLFSMSSSATTLHCNTILRRVLHGVRNEQLENIIANEPNIPDGANVPMYMRRQIGADFYIGDSQTVFGQLKRNQNVFAELRYSF